MLARGLALGLLLVVPLVAALPMLPMPPSHADYQLDEVVEGVVPVTLNWTPTPAPLGDPDGSNSVVVHRIYMAADHRAFAWIPLADVEMPTDTYSLDVPEGSTNIFAVTAINAAGLQSGPSNPVIIGDGYPHCSAFGWGYNPPHVDPEPHCLLPPPV